MKQFLSLALCVGALTLWIATAAAQGTSGSTVPEEGGPIAEQPVGATPAAPAPGSPAAAPPIAGPGAAQPHKSANIAAEAAVVAGQANANQPATVKPFSLIDPKTWPFTAIPVPEIATDPNQGTTTGVLPVFLFNNDHHQISTILAPDITYNTNMGAGGTFRYLAYPSENTQYYFIAGAAEKVARRFDVFYSTGRTHDQRWSFDGRFYFERDPTERFFGVGNMSQHSGETNYTTEQLYGEAKLGLNISPELQIALVEKPRWVRIQTGVLNNLPFIGTLYPHLKGLDGGSDWMHRVMISYDTRDSQDIPRHGGLFRLFTNATARQLGSSISYSQFGGEARNYFPIGDRFTLAGHVYLQYTPAGGETPFWAMGRLGGEDSLLTNQQTLRGYGAGRFVDNNLSVANIELRSRVWEHDIFDTHGVLELAPFLEAGKVFHDADDNPINRLHPVGGVGVRGIAQPFVVGYVDVGIGGQGASVFSGVNYPF